MPNTNAMIELLKRTAELLEDHLYDGGAEAELQADILECLNARMVDHLVEIRPVFAGVTLLSKASDEFAGYHRFENEEGEYGSFEVTWLPDHDEPKLGGTEPEWAPGWYWAAGFPGCLWDGEPEGPYDTSDAAYRAARGE